MSLPVDGFAGLGLDPRLTAALAYDTPTPIQREAVPALLTGRDLVGRGRLDLGAVSAVVLDEADEMLDMGFAEDIDALLAATPAGRQTMLFSATIPPRIEAVAKRHLRDPVRVRVAAERPAGDEPAAVRQTAYVVRAEHKVAALGRILEVERPASAIVFCRTREDTDALT